MLGERLCKNKGTNVLRTCRYLKKKKKDFEIAYIHDSVDRKSDPIVSIHKKIKKIKNKDAFIIRYGNCRLSDTRIEPDMCYRRCFS